MGEQTLLAAVEAAVAETATAPPAGPTRTRTQGHRRGMLTSLPSCGCDACDDGSDPELELLDAAVVDVVIGQVVHVVAPHGEVIGHGSGWDADGVGSPEEVEQVLDDARANRSPHRVTRGRPWW